MLKNNQSFCLGLSKPINFFNKADIELLKFAIMNQFMLHVSITYPVNAFIFRNIFLKKEIEDTKLIAKILGEDIRLFENDYLPNSCTFGRIDEDGSYNCSCQ